MSSILLSINPEYVNKIFLGIKKYEFRKTICKESIDKIVIYSTYPVMKVVGEVKVEESLVYSPKVIWNLTKEYSGVSADFFDEYYSGKKQAVAYKLGEIKKYDNPKELSEFGILQAPQSFVYLNTKKLLENF